MTLDVIKKDETIVSGAIKQKSKIYEHLLKLVEIANNFLLFSKENATRLKIAKAEATVKELEAQVKRIGTVKREVEDLKKKFPKALGDYIKKTLDVELFNQIYQSLNPHRRFKEMDFSVNVLHNKVGINFTAKHSKVNAFRLQYHWLLFGENPLI